MASNPKRVDGTTPDRLIHLIDSADLVPGNSAAQLKYLEAHHQLTENALETLRSYVTSQSSSGVAHIIIKNTQTQIRELVELYKPTNYKKVPK